MLGTLEQLKALPRVTDITRTMLRFGLHDIVHSVRLHRVLDWAEPVGDPTQLTAFLKFRALKMEAIFKQSALRRKAVATIDE